MSGEGVVTAEEKAAVQRRGPGARRPGGPPHMQLGMPGEKSMSFGPSAKRLLGWLAPDRARVLLILALTIVAVGLASVGPKVLGKATDSIFAAGSTSSPARASTSPRWAGCSSPSW